MVLGTIGVPPISVHDFVCKNSPSFSWTTISTLLGTTWYPNGTQNYFEQKFDISAFERTITRTFIIFCNGYIVRQSLSKNIVFGLQTITSSKFHFWIGFVLTIIVVTEVVEGPSTLTLKDMMLYL